MSKTAVTLPVLSDTMQTGRIIRWLKQPGDTVKRGDVLAEVESDKAIMDVEAYADGVLVGPLAAVDTDVAVKSTIAWIDDLPPQQTAVTSSPAPSPSAPPQTPEAAPAPTRPAGATPTPTEPTSAPATAVVATGATTSPVLAAALAAREEGGAASPFARGLATELGIDLSLLKPGIGGRIGAAQVLAAAIGPQLPHLDLGPVHRIERPSPLKAAMADNMQRTVHTPTFHVTTALDLRAIDAAAQAAHQSFTLLLAHACAQAIDKHPDFNACWTPGGLARRERIDIAIAVDTDGGLITPVLRDAMRPLAELAEDWRELRDKVARRRLVPADYTGATFYLSNLGMFAAVEQFDAIVPLGSAAILAVAAPAHDGRTRLTLTCDHRVIAGADAARFLATLAEQLQATQATIK
ncbi:MAG: dihydrolipoamide acetyltransferase family protein [Thiomonas sp.]